MTWIIGIDEAGYGPNLGPLVLSSAAVFLPDCADDRPLWRRFGSLTRRCGEPADDRLLVDDSKKVYQAVRGLARLELGVLTALGWGGTSPPADLAACLDLISPPARADLTAEVWFRGQAALPLAADAKGLGASVDCFTEGCRTHRVAGVRLRSVVVPTPRFNDLLDRWDTKSAVLGHSLVELLADAARLPEPGQPLCVCADKQGGRNFYSPLLGAAFPGGSVVVVVEGAERSSYRIEGVGRSVEIDIRPRADDDHPCVALASMASKYLREALMREFNGFWQAHVPGLRPTAGYPVDAARFLDDIRPALERLGISERLIWRRK
jgi:hypothetical protein